jgi:hypothetical protein
MSETPLSSMCIHCKKIIYYVGVHWRTDPLDEWDYCKSVANKLHMHEPTPPGVLLVTDTKEEMK